MVSAAPDLDVLTEKIIGCAIAVHRALGPGLLESVYRECMYIELKTEQMDVELERRLPLFYRDQQLATQLRIDLLVNKCVVVELKAVDAIHPVFLAQVITYLKLSGCPAGLLLNFNATSIRAGLRRLDHPDIYQQRIRLARGRNGQPPTGEDSKK